MIQIKEINRFPLFTKDKEKNLKLWHKYLQRKYQPIVLNKQNITKGPVIYIANHQNITLDAAFSGFGIFPQEQPVYIRGANLSNKGDNLENLLNSIDVIILERDDKKKAIKGLRQICSTLKNKRSIWVAQTKGRQKNGIFETDEQILKGILKYNLPIQPIRITYEFEPTVGLMAAQREYGKSKEDDKEHMLLGILGETGRVFINYGKPLGFKIDKNPRQEELKKQLLYFAKEHLDKEIRTNLTVETPMHKFVNGLKISKLRKLECQNHISRQVSLVTQKYSTHSKHNPNKIKENIIEFYINSSKQ